MAAYALLGIAVAPAGQARAQGESDPRHPPVGEISCDDWERRVGDGVYTLRLRETEGVLEAPDRSPYPHEPIVVCIDSTDRSTRYGLTTARGQTQGSDASTADRHETGFGLGGGEDTVIQHASSLLAPLVAECWGIEQALRQLEDENQPAQGGRGPRPPDSSGPRDELVGRLRDELRQCQVLAVQVADLISVATDIHEYRDAAASRMVQASQATSEGLTNDQVAQLGSLWWGITGCHSLTETVPDSSSAGEARATSSRTHVDDCRQLVGDGFWVPDSANDVVNGLLRTRCSSMRWVDGAWVTPDTRGPRPALVGGTSGVDAPRPSSADSAAGAYGDCAATDIASAQDRDVEMLREASRVYRDQGEGHFAPEEGVPSTGDTPRAYSSPFTFLGDGTDSEERRVALVRAEGNVRLVLNDLASARSSLQSAIVTMADGYQQIVALGERYASSARARQLVFYVGDYPGNTLLTFTVHQYRIRYDFDSTHTRVVRTADTVDFTHDVTIPDYEFYRYELGFVVSALSNPTYSLATMTDPMTMTSTNTIAQDSNSMFLGAGAFLAFSFCAQDHDGSVYNRRCEGEDDGAVDARRFLPMFSVGLPLAHELVDGNFFVGLVLPYIPYVDIFVGAHLGLVRSLRSGNTVGMATSSTNVDDVVTTSFGAMPMVSFNLSNDLFYMLCPQLRPAN